MKSVKSQVRGAVYGVLLASTALSSAYAYGPEGMFGGRLNPDSTIVLSSPVEIEARPARAQSVLQHPRPDYDPVPITVRSFEVFPAVEMGYAYDSNIFAQKNNTTDDHLATLRPAVSVFSNWNRHALAATAFGDLNFFTGNPDENAALFVTGLQGRYDIMSETWLAGRLGYQHLAEPRSSADDAGGSEPTTFNVSRGGLTAYRGIGKVKLEGTYDLSRYFYNDTPSSVGFIDQSFRDRTYHELGGKVVYDLTANFKPYVKTGYNWRVYDNFHTHQSQGYEAVVGTTADFGGITSVDAYIGWMSQDYENFGSNEVNDGVKFGGRLEWNVTGLTSLVLETSRTIEETTLAGFNSFKATGGSATLTHELRRNILLEGDFSFTRDDYHGIGERSDDNIAAGGGVRYLINRHLYTDLVYSWNKRMSDDSASDFSKHIVNVRLGVQM